MIKSLNKNNKISDFFLINDNKMNCLDSTTNISNYKFNFNIYRKYYVYMRIYANRCNNPKCLTIRFHKKFCSSITYYTDLNVLH